MKTVQKFFAGIDRYTPMIVIALVVLNISFGFLYTYFVNTTIHNTVVFDRGQKEIINTRAEVARLESEYLQLSNTITLDFAYAQGFTDALKNQNYISGQTVARTLSFNAL